MVQTSSILWFGPPIYPLSPLETATETNAAHKKWRQTKGNKTTWFPCTHADSKAAFSENLPILLHLRTCGQGLIFKHTNKQGDGKFF